MYKVLLPFCDGENGAPYSPKKGGVGYKPGDTYPKGGFEPSAEHIKYLLSKDNKFSKPVIEKVKE